jgi:hypothetical protein
MTTNTKQGACEFWGSPATWEVVSSRAEGRISVDVVRVTFVGDDRPMYAWCEPGDVPRPLCRHEHLTAATADCPEAIAAARRLDARETERRIAALPAPDGARYVAHCGAYWSAAKGGACPTCAAAADALVPHARVERAKFERGMWWVRAVNVSAASVAVDLGVERHPRTQAMGDSLLVSAEAAPDPAAMLAAAGWRVEGGARRRRVA